MRASALNINQQNLKNKQIHADTCRNIQTNNVTRKAQQPKLQSLVGDFEIIISCTKPRSPMMGAAVLAPLGAFGSAAPLWGQGV